MDVKINRNKKYQTVKGFGASGAWTMQEVGGWENTDPESGMSVRDRLMQLLYDRKNGIGLNIYRYNIGAGSKGNDNDDIGNPLRRTECFLTRDGYDFSRDKNAVYMMKKACEYGADEVIIFRKLSA